jgi:hypothetical protein
MAVGIVAAEAAWLTTDQLQQGCAKPAVVEMAGEHPPLIRHLHAKRSKRPADGGDPLAKRGVSDAEHVRDLAPMVPG